MISFIITVFRYRFNALFCLIKIINLHDALPIFLYHCCLFMCLIYILLSLSFVQTPSWFPTDNQSKLNGIFFVKNISTTKAPNVTKTKLNIQPQVIFPYFLKQNNLNKSIFIQQFKILTYKCVTVPTDIFS